jgi:hypothetical protein
MLKIKIDKRTFILFLLVISTFFLPQNYNTAILFAQNESGSVEGVNQNPDGSILVCEFVQFCSDPVEFSGEDNRTAVITPVTPQGEAQTTAEGEAQTTAEGEAQTTSDSSDRIPDVTSNISLIMTPDLPDSMTEEDLQNSNAQNLSSVNQNLQNSLNTTDDSQLVVPQNATVITPDVQIPSETIDENISMTIQDINDTVSTESGINNQSELAETTPLNNTTNSMDGSNMSQSALVDDTIDSTAANETIDSTAANETIDSTAANETIDSTAANETNQLDTSPQIENPSGMTNATTTSQATSTIDQQDNTSIINEAQPNPGATTENQTNPTAFLDPIINPFKQLFGLK